MDLTVGALLEITGATLAVEPPGAQGDALAASAFRAVAIDSRQVMPGDLFVALPGARTDGARFVGDAFARGALAALTARPPELTEQQRAARRAVSGDAPFAALVTPGPLAALQRAAAAWRARHDSVRVVGVTGSVGKTTTREAVAGVLSAAMPVLVSPRSYNNEIGLPLTLLGLGQEHRAAVLEMGMYARGEIAELCAMARPHVGVVTMVAPIHLERLGSIEAIAAAKAELVQALPRDGVAVLNGDDARVRAMAAQSAARAVFFGLGEDNDWRATEIDDRGLDGLSFTLRHGAWSARIDTAVVGRHFVHALLAAAAVTGSAGILPAPRDADAGDGRDVHAPRTSGDRLEAGAPSQISVVAAPSTAHLDRIAAALTHVRIGERQRFLEAPSGRLVIDDSWNASPPSVLAALDVLAAVPRRRVAILGEMLELGAETEPAHREVGRRAGAVLDALIAVGANGRVLADEARRAGLPSGAVAVVATPAEIPAAADTLLRPGDAVLVKGSRGLHLEDTVKWLVASS